ncbi:MAG: SDR family oxidoreductase [Archangium sp.]|nr:SDR family oxidoreductase [Archangium sp.]
MSDFSGKVVWVTGASSGIGEAVAVAFAKQGAKLVLSARRAAELERVAETCAPAEVLVLPLDLGGDDFDALTAKVLARFGHVDVMVHNGGLSQRALVKDTAMSVHRRLMEVNYFGAIDLTRAVLPSMLQRGTGHFVVISSVMGKIGTPMRSAYAASKHALHGYFDCLRAEVTDAGLFVTLITPGYVKTEVSKNSLDANGTPIGTTGHDIANGYPADLTAEQILAAVRAHTSETFVGKLGKERAALLLKRFMPAVLERVVRNTPPK